MQLQYDTMGLRADGQGLCLVSPPALGPAPSLVGFPSWNKRGVAGFWGIWSSTFGTAAGKTLSTRLTSTSSASSSSVLSRYCSSNAWVCEEEMMAFWNRPAFLGGFGAAAVGSA